MLQRMCRTKKQKKCGCNDDGGGGGVKHTVSGYQVSMYVYAHDGGSTEPD